MAEFTPFINLGLGGVALYMMYKLASNHVEHNTQAIQKLEVAVTELITWLKAQRER